MRIRYIADLNPTKGEVRYLDSGTQVSFVPMETVGEYGGINLEFEKPIASVMDGYTYFRDGDVVVAKITPCFENGKGALASGLKNGVAFGTTELHVLRPRDDLDGRFLFYITMSDRFRRVGAADMYGAGGQKRISDDFVRNFVHWIPPIDRQRSISAFLDRETGKIDALVAKKEELIKLLQERRTALITHVVTKGLDPNAPMKESGIEWLGEIPAHWEVWTVRNLIRSQMIEVQDGNHGEIHPVASDYVSTGIPFVMANDVRNGSIDLTNCRFISKELADSLRIGFSRASDVLLTHKGTIGETAIVPDEIDSPYLMLTPQVTYYRMKSGPLTRNFLYRQFQSGAFQAQMRVLAGGGTTRSFIGIMDQRNLHVAIPPEGEQVEIEAHLVPILHAFGQLLARVDSGISRLAELRTALISAAVTGKIDVRKEVT